MKYLKLLLLLLLSNILISQSSPSNAKTNQQILAAPVTYMMDGHNLNPPICFDPIILRGATVVKRSDKKKESNYYIHDAKKINPSGSTGEVIKDFDHLSFKTFEGNIDYFPLQKVGEILNEYANDKQQFETFSKEYISDINSLSIDSQSSFLEAMAANPDLAKAWLTLNDIGYTTIERTNLSNLNTVSGYFIKYPNRTPSDVKVTASLFSDINDYLSILSSIVDNSPVDGTKYEDFESVSGFEGVFQNAEYSFYLWSKEKWATLESFFNKNSINGEWPPNNGGYDEVYNVPLKAGLKFDRYGNALTIDSITGPLLGGSFTSPILNNKPFKFDQRALNKPEDAYDFYYVIEIIKDLPFNSLDATVIPWFGQVGNGKQTKWNISKDPETGYPLTWNKLVEFGFIKATIKSSPSGKYPQFVNFAIQ